MVGTTGLTDRMFGGSGFDWADYKDDAIGVTIDIDGRFFDQPPVPGSGASALARFDIMEGLSGSKHDDYLFGDNAVDLVGGEVGGAPGGSALTNIALINGLQSFLDTALEIPGTHVTAFTTGNIILGGDGSDIMMGRDGEDLIDGDAWLNVRIGVYAKDDVNHTGPRSPASTACRTWCRSCSTAPTMPASSRRSARSCMRPPRTVHRICQTPALSTSTRPSSRATWRTTRLL